jgi:hypothetical protein
MEHLQASVSVDVRSCSSTPLSGSVASSRPIEIAKEREAILVGLLRVLARAELRRSASERVREILERHTE